MKRSRIICSIVTAAYILLSIAIVVILGMDVAKSKGNVRIYIKIIHLALFCSCVFIYSWIVKRLEKKTESRLLITAYKCLFIAAVVFVSRLILVYGYKNIKIDDIVPSFKIGFGSYLNYIVLKLVGNQLYANAIINTIITFIAAILIKKIVANITENDTMATITSLIYVFLPQSMVNVTKYIRVGYNLLFILLGFFVYLKIIDEVKRYNVRDNKYIILSIFLATVASIEIALGGTFIFWFLLLLITTLAATYIDSIRINGKGKLKGITNYRVKRLIEKIDEKNISKLFCSFVIVTIVTAIFSIALSNINSINNYEYIPNFSILIDKLLLSLGNSRRYYMLLIIFAVFFELVAICLKRKFEIKGIILKTGYLILTILLPFGVTDTYMSYKFDAFLLMLLVTNLCNIYYNREEKIKLIKEKN